MFTLHNKSNKWDFKNSSFNNLIMGNVINGKKKLLHLFTTFVSGQLFHEAWYLNLRAIEHMTIKEEHDLFFPINFQILL